MIAVLETAQRGSSYTSIPAALGSSSLIMRGRIRTAGAVDILTPYRVIGWALQEDQKTADRVVIYSDDREIGRRKSGTGGLASCTLHRYPETFTFWPTVG